MPTTVDLHAVEHESTDERTLNLYLQRLVGEPFLQLRFTYGDELQLHFGASVPYRSPRLAPRTRGAFVLSARGSEWSVSNDPVARLVVGREADSDARCTEDALAPDELEASCPIAAGARVASADAFRIVGLDAAETFGCSLALSDGSTVHIHPSPAEGDELPAEALADWELLMPFERILTVGPGARWSYLPTT